MRIWIFPKTLFYPEYYMVMKELQSFICNQVILSGQVLMSSLRIRIASAHLPASKCPAACRKRPVSGMISIESGFNNRSIPPGLLKVTGAGVIVGRSEESDPLSGFGAGLALCRVPDLARASVRAGFWISDGFKAFPEGPGSAVI